MSKKIVSILLAIMMVFSITACKGKDVAQDNPELQQKQETTVNENYPEGKDTIKQPEADTELKEIAYPGDPETGEINATELAGILSESDYGYLWFEDLDGDKVIANPKLFALTEGSFKSRIEDQGIEDEINSYSDMKYKHEPLDIIASNAKFVFENNMANGNAERYIGYFNVPFSAFNGEVKTDDVNSFNEIFQANDLDILFRNAKVEKLLCSDITVGSQWLTTAQVKVTVDCYKNSGKFKNISWIPEEGMEKEVTFSITYMSYFTEDFNLHEVQVYDICEIK